MKQKNKPNEIAVNDTKKRPNIVFANSGLIAAVSRWVGEKKSITEEFGNILIQLGYVNGETVILNNFNPSDFSFSCNCNSPEQPKTAKISLRFGDFEDFAEVTISTDEYKKNYECLYSLEKKEEYLRLQWYSINNPKNGNSVYHLLSRYHCQISVGKEIDGECYEFSINASKPDNIIESGVINSDGNYELKNIEELQNYLLGLSFPINIEEVYRKLCEISLSPVSEFPQLTLKGTKKIGDEDPETTDLVLMVDGEIKEFTINRHGDVISVDDSGNWSCKSEHFAISQDEKGNIDYSIISIPEKEFFELDPISDRFNVVKVVVNDVKKKVKTLFGKSFK